MVEPKKRIVRFSYLQMQPAYRVVRVTGKCNSIQNFQKIILGARAIGFDADEIDDYVSKIIRQGAIRADHD